MRGKSHKRYLAFELWCETSRVRKAPSLGKELGVSPEQIRKWKHQDSWETSEDPPKRGRGAPKGNKNSVGNRGGAPKKNENAIKHGEYRTMWEDMLTDEERIKLMFVETDPIKIAENEIAFLELRERRMMQRINQIMDGWDSDIETRKHQLVDEDITDFTIIDDDGKVSQMQIKQPAFREVERITKTSQKLERILAIEDALTRVQDKKAKWADLLYKFDMGILSKEEIGLRIQRMKLENKAAAEKEW